MGRVTLEPATREDFAELAAVSKNTPAVPPYRTFAIAAKVDGRVIGIGGFSFLKNGVTAAFADVTEEARKYPISIHRAGCAAIALAKEHGVRQLTARGESHSASRRWLLRLGFLPVQQGSETYYVLKF